MPPPIRPLIPATRLPLAHAPMGGHQPPPPGAVPPPNPQTLYERGLTLAAMRDFTGALQALGDATALDPSLAAAWRALGETLAAAGEHDAAYAALAKSSGPTAIKPPRPRAPAKLQVAERQLRATLAGRPPRAIETLLRQQLTENPTDAPALLILAQTLMEQGRASQAEPLLARALDLAPAYVPARHLLAVTLFRTGKEIHAIPHIQRLLADDPRNIAYRTLHASSLAMTGQVAPAIAIFEALIKEVPKRADIWLSYAKALQQMNRRDDSARAFRTILDFAPETGQAHWSLQILTSGKPAPEDIAAMRAQLANPALPAETRFHFHYALAYAMEKSADYAESFAHYAAGAKLWRAQLAYKADDTTQRVRRAKSVFTPALLAERATQGCPDPAPIFILGMPRAGSTLIEQILASHSAIEGTKELPELGHLVHELAPNGAQPYPECLLSLNPARLAELGQRYIDRTRIYRVTGRPYFIDKMPTNWFDIGLISLILPNAKIIDARRDPMATCFAAFKKYFSQGQAFTYDLTELGRYYTDYLDLMAHFDAAIPGRIHRVLYEDMVADTDAQINRLLTYCGVDFEPACLRFWETERAVTTASADQVRRPIFRDGLDQWRHFEPWLGPLKTALGLPG